MAEQQNTHYRVVKEGLRYYLLGAVPPCLSALIALRLGPSFFIAFALAYFIAWALFLPELQQRAKQANYRFSTLRLIFSLYELLDRCSFCRFARVKRVMIVALFAPFFLLTLDLVGLIGLVAGIVSFEGWFSWQKRYLAHFPKSLNSE